MDKEVPGGSRSGSQGNYSVSGQHEFHASRKKRTTVQYEMNETHGHPIFLRRGAYPGQNPFIEALPY